MSKLSSAVNKEVSGPPTASTDLAIHPADSFRSKQGARFWNEMEDADESSGQGPSTKRRRRAADSLLYHLPLELRMMIWQWLYILSLDVLEKSTSLLQHAKNRKYRLHVPALMRVSNVYPRFQQEISDFLQAHKVAISQLSDTMGRGKVVLMLDDTASYDFIPFMRLTKNVSTNDIFLVSEGVRFLSWFPRTSLARLPLLNDDDKRWAILLKRKCIQAITVTDLYFKPIFRITIDPSGLWAESCACEAIFSGKSTIASNLHEITSDMRSKIAEGCKYSGTWPADYLEYEYRAPRHFFIAVESDEEDTKFIEWWNGFYPDEMK